MTILKAQATLTAKGGCWREAERQLSGEDWQIADARSRGADVGLASMSVRVVPPHTGKRPLVQFSADRLASTDSGMRVSPA